MRLKPWLLMTAAISQACFVCVARGARVKTPRGLRNIEDLHVGSEVFAVDPLTGELHATTITGIRTAKRECGALDGLRLTPSHPLYDPLTHEWAPAGDWLLGVRTTVLTIEGPKKVEKAERFTGVDDVYDLSVAHPAHTFVADGVVVHNKDYHQEPWRCDLPDGGSISSDGPPEYVDCPFEPGERYWECPSEGAAARWPCQGSADRSFESGWAHGEGSEEAALRDGTTWDSLEGADAGQHLAIIPGESVDFPSSGRVLRVTAAPSAHALVRRELAGNGSRTVGVYFRFEGGVWNHQALVSLLSSADGPGLTALGLHGTGEKVRAYFAFDGKVRIIEVPLEPGHWYRLDASWFSNADEATIRANLYDGVTGDWLESSFPMETLTTTKPQPTSFAVGTFSSPTSEGTVYLGRPAVSDTWYLGP